MLYSKPDTIPHYSELQKIIKSIGYDLIELNIFKKKSSWTARFVIHNKNGVGLDDCSKVHRIVLPRLEVLLDSREIFVEVMSPGLDRLIKNAYEFSFFEGKLVKIWNTETTDWIQGIIVSSDEERLKLKTEEIEKDFSYKIINKAKLIN